MPEPIRQEISTTFDGAGIEAAVEKTREMGQATDQAAKRAADQATASRQQQAALQQLVDEEISHTRALESGTEATAESIAESANRQSRIKTLAEAIRARKERDSEAAAETAKLTAADRDAASAESGRALTAGELRERLQDLVRESVRYTAAADRGEAVTAEAGQAEKLRSQQVDSLGRELAQLEDEQAAVNSKIKEGVDSHRSYGDASDATTEKLGTLGGGLGSVSGVVGNLAGAFGFSGGLAFAVNKAAEEIDALNQKLERNIELSRGSAKATLDLQTLSLKFNPEDEEFLSNQSRISGRSRTELAPSFTKFKSGTSSLSPDEQRRQFAQSVVLPGLSSSGGLDALTELAVRTLPFVPDPQERRNLQVLQTQQAGEGDPSALANSTAELLPIGQLAGLNVEDTFALQAFGTDVFNSAIAKTKNEQLLLRFQTNPQVAEDLAGLDAPRDLGFFGQIDALRSGVQGGSVTSDDLTRVAGGENVGLLQALLERPEQLNQKREEIGRFDDGEDIFGNFLEDLFKRSPRARFFQIESQQERTTDARAIDDPSNSRVAAARAALADIFSKLQDQGEIFESSAEARLERFDELVALGQNEIDAVGLVERPGLFVDGPGTILGNTQFSLGTSSFTGIQAEVARRLAAGVQGPEGFIAPVGGAEDIAPVPIRRFDVDADRRNGKVLLNEPEGGVDEQQFEETISKVPELRDALVRIGVEPDPVQTVAPLPQSGLGLPVGPDTGGAVGEPLAQGDAASLPGLVSVLGQLVPVLSGAALGRASDASSSLTGSAGGADSELLGQVVFLLQELLVQGRRNTTSGARAVVLSAQAAAMRDQGSQFQGFESPVSGRF